MNPIDAAVASARRTGRPIALDTQVLIGHMEQRLEIAGLVSAFISDPTVIKVISTVTLAEILTLPASRDSAEQVLVFADAIHRIPGMRVVALDRDVAIETAHTRARTGLRPPDATVIATAVMSNAIAILGNDRRWRQKPLGIRYVHLGDLVTSRTWGAGKSAQARAASSTSSGRGRGSRR